MADKAHENKRFWIGLPEDQAINAASDLPDIDLTIFFIGEFFFEIEIVEARDLSQVISLLEKSKNFRTLVKLSEFFKPCEH